MASKTEANAKRADGLEDLAEDLEELARDADLEADKLRTELEKTP